MDARVGRHIRCDDVENRHSCSPTCSAMLQEIILEFSKVEAGRRVLIRTTSRAEKEQEAFDSVLGDAVVDRIKQMEGRLAAGSGAGQGARRSLHGAAKSLAVCPGSP